MPKKCLAEMSEYTEYNSDCHIITMFIKDDNSTKLNYKFCHNTPLLQALKAKKIDNLQQVQQLSLLRNALLNKSKSRIFYLNMFKHGNLHTDTNFTFTVP